MSKTLSLMIFLTIVIIVVSSVHYYLWLRLVRDTGIIGRYRSIATFSLIFMAVLLPLSIYFSRALPYNYFRPVLWIAYLWLGIMMLLFVTFIAIDIIKLLIGIVNYLSSTSNNKYDPSRKKFITGIISYGATALVAGTTIFGVKNYLSKAKVKDLKLKVEGLPDVFNDMTIVQLSDLHIGQLMTKTTLKEIVDQVNDLNPDIIVITGDLVDGNTELLLDEITPLKDLKAREGIYFVTGNHEYYSGVEKWLAEIKRMGIIVLHNENVKITKEDKFFYLAGVTDKDGERYSKHHKPDYEKALGSIENDKIKILLAHQPVQVNEAAKYGVDLMLSGHTHGGQIWPFHFLVYLQQPYLKGLYKHKNTNLYVNQGTGCWGPPIRIGSENEITRIILKA